MDKEVVKKKIIEVINESLERDVTEFMEDNELQEIGLNSVSFIKIVVKLEQIFDVEFEDDALEYTKFKYLVDLCDYVYGLLQ